MFEAGLEGPFQLSITSIDEHVPANAPGVFALSDVIATDGSSAINCVGRSDDDVAAALKSWIGRYKYFGFVYCLNAARAYAKECELFHQFHPTDNSAHPVKSDPLARCSRCGA